MGIKHRILHVGLLEDDEIQARKVNQWLAEQGHECVVFHKAHDFQCAYRKDSFDVVLLDWNLPDQSGLEVLLWLRKHIASDVPVLFVTARQQETDIVTALDKGADDYLVKPIRPQELLARIRVLTRRTQPESLTLQFWPFLFDIRARRLCRYEVELQLTDREYDMALFLFKNKGRVLSRKHLLSAVWGTAAELNTRTVDTHASRLRKKLKLGGDQPWKLTGVYQHGYRLEQQSDIVNTEKRLLVES